MHIARALSSLVGALAIAWTLSISTPRQAQAQDFGPVNGTWEGSLGPISGPGLSESNKPLPIRMIVRDEAAQVFTGENFNDEVKSGRFKVERVATNMIIFAIDSGTDNDGLWVETWAFVITQKDRNTLITNLYRVVNNTDVPLNLDFSKFSSAKTGELKRVSPE
ncbi:hypothetical protein AYJ54_15430 [Bradyrhizobium centrolobii]|uniref:Lipocalin-like domain-containing protein n=1 Tax=Bradyrhizobium centrolobii TaxID=1505087 RepID=A0A176YLY1_9BRAD|nr:hypothetical protein [Bradyrhizobium centrolobii]OAF08132.1 hypothetical protein AYJ54_15430 [Bradyrhizobium centrolobii]